MYSRFSCEHIFNTPCLECHSMKPVEKKEFNKEEFQAALDKLKELNKLSPQIKEALDAIHDIVRPLGDLAWTFAQTLESLQKIKDMAEKKENKSPPDTLTT